MHSPGTIKDLRHMTRHSPYQVILYVIWRQRRNLHDRKTLDQYIWSGKCQNNVIVPSFSEPNRETSTHSFKNTVLVGPIRIYLIFCFSTNARRQNDKFGNTNGNRQSFTVLCVRINLGDRDYIGDHAMR
jgi:hypothetical protein